MTEPKALDMRLGWRGISARTSYFSADSKAEGHGGWLAVSVDPSDGDVAVSLWTDDEGGIGQRRFAFWLTPELAQRLAHELRVEAVRPDMSNASPKPTEGAHDADL